MREKQRAAEKRRRFFIQGGIGVAIIAIAVIVTLVIVQNNANNVVAASQAGGPKNMISDGILFHGVDGKATAVETAAIKKGGKPVATDESKLKKTANIVEYIDLQCPYCQEFIETNLANEDKWVAAGKATLEIHPISFLDESSLGNRYSSRAANAVACVAAYDPNSVLGVLKVMYKDQPAEDTDGATNAKILSMLSAGGVSNKKVTGCVNGESYKSWVTAATARANVSVFGGSSTNNLISTPTVIVNGQKYTGSLTSASTFTKFVNSVKPGTAS